MNISQNLFTPSGMPAAPTISGDAQQLLGSLREGLPEPVIHPILVVVNGLPGTGKSFFSHCLAKRVPLAVLESDALRKEMVPSPLHTAKESARLFQAVHELIYLLLEQGVPVLLDATSLVEAHRERLYHIVDRRNARVIMVRLEAPPEVVRQRLEARANTTQRQDHSSADWKVYQRMRPSQKPIRHNHLVVDTSQDIVPAVEKVAHQISRWIRRGR